MIKTALSILAAAYGEAKKLLAFAYFEAKDIIGTVARRGWRPLIPWMFMAICGGIGARVVLGLPLSIDVVQLVAVIAPLTLPTLLALWTRSVETRAGVANSPGGGAFNSPGASAGFA